MLGTYEIKNERIYFKTKYDADFVTEVKEIVGRKYDPETKSWDCPLNFATSVPIQNLINKFKLEDLNSNSVSPSDDIIHQFDIENSVQRIIPSVKQKIQGMKLPWKVRDYQVHGISYQLASKRCINASAPGTGKTMMAILAVEIENLFPCVVVVPASVKYNWQRQWNIMNPKRTTSVINNKEDNFGADVLILTYDSVGKKEVISKEGEDEKIKVNLKYEQLEKLSIKSVICDESHAIKTGKAIRTKGVKRLTKGVEYIFMLTGTPVMNRPAEIISPLSILGQFDQMFGNWRDFVYKYCGAYETRFGLDYTSATNTRELNEKMRKICYYRVEKRDVLKDLPPVQETLYLVDIDNRKEYNRASNDLITYLKENYGQLKADNALYAQSLVLISTLSQLSTKGKIEGICEWLDSFIESSDEKIVVFGIHVEFLKSLSKKYKCDVIIGEVDHKKRQLIIDNFQKNENRILFMNIAVGSIGIDGLQNVCSTVLFYELPWKSTDLEQAISRVERSGQKNNIEVFYLLGKDTIDEDMWELILSKQMVTDSINIGIDVESQQYMSQFIKKMIQK